jgi:predicted ATPase
MPLRYRLSFTESGQRFLITDERIENQNPYPGHDVPFLYFGYDKGRPILNLNSGIKRQLQREDVDAERSILAQRRDPDQYPEITYLGETLERIRLYREWAFGRFNASRLSNQPDQRNDFLLEDGRNLSLMLNRLRREPAIKQRLLDGLRLLYEGIDDFDVSVDSGSIQFFVQEGRNIIPATRLSDGTVRYMYLLAILLHPTPPPLIAIEEPELGLHPDIISTIAELLVEASEKTQLIVTTHSTLLVDALSATPEDVLVCEKFAGSTQMRRLALSKLNEWLQHYSLGELWRRGELGGNRW